MNFTREPLIETVISAKDGYKLALRNSKGGGQEEFFVDALEVISFGTGSFYRSLEKPKSFLVPVNDYEIIEVRETRMVLKSSTVERGIKIGGGRETALKPSRDEKSVDEGSQESGDKVEKRREKRRTRKRRTKSEESDVKEEEPASEGVEEPLEKPSLIPPPSTLISETISRYKEVVIHEPPQEEEESASKKETEFFEEPSEDSSGENLTAQPSQAIENDEEIPI